MARDQSPAVDGEPGEDGPLAPPPGQQRPDPRKLSGIVRNQATEHGRELLVELASGTLATVALGLLGLVLVQVGVAQQSVKPGEKFELPSLSLFQPAEFWKSLSGLIVDWSQANEWLLLGLGLAAALLTVAAFLGWRWTRTKKEDEKAAKSLLVQLAEEKLLGLKMVSSLGMVSILLLGAYGYQQYLWRVALPVPTGQIGIAFTRQLGSTVAQDRLADDLKQLGHANVLAMRELPVTFDASDIDQARALARRIGADAVVIYRDETDTVAPTTARTRGPGLAAPLPDATTTHHVAYVVFANPSIGVQVPLAQRDAGGQVNSITYREKEGVEVPRVEADDVSKVMEATAGILLYDQDRYLPAIAHLRAAVPAQGDHNPSDAIVDLYLGHAYHVLGQDAAAATAYQQAITLWEAEKPLPAQDRLLLAGADAQQATLLFDQEQVDQAEALLQKAVALRAPLDDDQTALSDPAIVRQFHSTYGAVYLGLMDIATYRKDQDAATLWSGHAQAEAKALRASSDRSAQESAIWLQYRTGDCSGAAQEIATLLGQKPNDIVAHQLAERLAYLRSNERLPGDITEVAQQLNAVLQLDPTNLPELQSKRLFQALSASLEDPGYLGAEKQTVDTILAADPNNVEALQGYLSDAMDITAWPFLAQPGGDLWSAEYGDARTFLLQQAAWKRDPAHITAALDGYNTLRPYVTRWAEELQPQSATPLLYKARLSHLSESLVYTLQYVPGTSKLPGIVEQYPALWQRAVTDATQVLNGGRTASPQEQAEADVLLSELWNDQFWVRTGDKAPDAAAASEQAVQFAEAAAKLMASNPPATADEQYSAANVYLNLFTALTTAKVPASNAGNQALADQDATAATAAETRWITLMKQVAAASSSAVDFATRPVCQGAQGFQQGDQALQKGDAASAVSLLTAYTVQFPRDPDALADLGWAQYRNGDTATAIVTTERFAQMAPDSYLGPANLAVMFLAQGKADEAQQAYKGALGKLQGQPGATRLLHFRSMAADLLALARDNAQARTGVKAVLPLLEGYLTTLPATDQSTLGSQLIDADNALGGAALWAGDTQAASRLYAAGLTINPTSLLVLTNVGLTKLTSGDSAGAQTAYDRAIASATAYLTDTNGQPLQGQERQTAAGEANQELTAAVDALHLTVKQQPALQPAAEEIIAQLQATAGRLE